MDSKNQEEKKIAGMDLGQVFRHIFLRIFNFYQASLEELI